MDLIHFHGLNCYHDCVVTIANHLGLDYSAAFSTLWSETDFRYDPHREIYLTKRMIANLEALGAKAESFGCFSQKETIENTSMFYDGEFMIVGMDAFYIPWNQFYRVFHGPHYFIVKNAKSEKLICFDPTYNKKNEQIAYEEFIAHTFDICRVSKVAATTLTISISDEAHEIIRTHPSTRTDLLLRISDCVKEGRENIVLLAKYIDAMICNRFLYRFFLEKHSDCHTKKHFLQREYFSEWRMVKNGLYKAAVTKNKDRLVKEICDRFRPLMNREIAIAEEMVSP